MRKFFFLFFLWIPFFATAQSCKLQLQILDDQNKPLAGVALDIDGKTKAISDENGNLSLESDAPCAAETAELSYLGFAKQKIRLADYLNVSKTVRLSPENTLLQSATITTSRFEKPVSEATVSIEVLKPALIDNSNTKKLDDVLQKIPGVQVMDGQANIRGGSGYSYGAGSRVLVLMDDIPILQADAGSVNWRDLPIENLTQIEVVKGAASALYGSSAMNGIINVRTAFAKNEPETKFATFGTAYGTPSDGTKKWWTSSNAPYDFGAMLSQKIKFGKLDVAASAFYFNQNSFNQKTYEKYGRFNLATRYRINDRLSIALNANYNRGESQSFFYWNGDGSFVGTASTYSATNRTRYSIDPSVTYLDRANNRHKLLTRYYSVANDADGGRNNFSKLYYGEYQFLRNFEEINLAVTAGLVGVQTNSESQLFGNANYTSKNLAIYTQLDKKFFQKLNVSVGFRYESNVLLSPEIIKINAFKTDTIPNGRTAESKPIFRIGANYALGKATFLRASWGQGYRYPTIAEKFIQTTVGFQILPNPKLVSETGWSQEIGVKQGFILGGCQGFIDVAGFWSEYTNMMEFNLDRSLFAFRSFNVGNTRITGFETTIAAQGKMFGANFSTLAGYTYIKPIFRDFDAARDTLNSTANYNVLKYRFKHNFKTDAEWSWDKFSIGFSINYLSKMEAIDRLFEVFIPGLKNWRKTEAENIYVFDMRAAYKISSHLKVSLLGNNLFNQMYTLRPALLEAPQNFSFRVDAKF